VIGARPGTGKTAWAVQEVRKVAARGDAALMFSLEMPASQLVERMVIQDGPIDAGRMKFGQLTPDDLHNFERSKRLLASSPIEIVDKPGICLPELRSRVRRAKARAQALLGKQLRLVVIDYIQLMGGPAHSREERVAENSKGLLGISKEFDVTVIALSQLNRGSARDGSKARSPTMDDLRESGQIEQDATTIVLLWSPDENQVSLREIVVAKCRTGTPGRMPAWFEGKHLTLMDLDEDYAGVEGITGDDFFDRL
jgi:replicative DNA helicase